MTIAVTLRTLFALGPINLARVGLYRLTLKAGIHPVQRLGHDVPKGPFYKRTMRKPTSLKPRSDWQKGSANYFGQIIKGVSEPPDWHVNPRVETVSSMTKLPWWKIPDFDSTTGDIKSIWETSRFDWLIAMSQRASLGNAEELSRLNAWLENWVQSNPPYFGINWKCGQEASIRVIHLALSACILGQVLDTSEALLSLIRLHLKRIGPTMGYAIGQANNHGTSEAAALYIGGSWLASTGDAEGKRWQAIGRHWLEERAQTLIMDDGTFSQYSTNYHRLMLDTYAFVEYWRKRQSLPEFSKNTHFKLRVATNWLEQVTDKDSGDVPNIGANDGAQILKLSDVDYRDYRSSVQLASVLFRKNAAYPIKGSWDLPLNWLDITKPENAAKRPSCQTQNDGGLHILRSDNAVAYMRFPKYKFRPGHADALHCDLWIDGENITRDDGTYSYNPSVAGSYYFGKTQAHNTIEFDGRDQMPRLGRFLFGAWLKAQRVSFAKNLQGKICATASYRDAKGAEHYREITLDANKFTCIDKISGFSKQAVLRWRLQPGVWKLEGNTVSGNKARIVITGQQFQPEINMNEGYESRYYMQKNVLPVIEVRVIKPTTLTTEIIF